jgi:3-hydroxybutyrate dehydrogenase
VARIDEFPPDRFAAIVRVMLEAPFLLIRAVLQACTAAASEEL